MCNMIVISTTSDLNLEKFNENDLLFNKEMPGIPEEKFLKYPNKWYVGSSHGCSCSFRHLMVENFPDLGFAEPVDWFEEDQEDIDATLKLVTAFKEIISDGSKLDCIDAWSGDEKKNYNLSGQVTINFSIVSDAAFRLIEGYEHEIVNKT